MSDEQKEEKQEKEEKDYPKDKQQADQYEATIRQKTEEVAKAQADKNAVAEELATQAMKVAELEEQLSAKTTEYPELDSDLVDKNVIKTITQLKSDLKAEKERTTALEGKATQYEKTEQQRAANTHRNALIEKICKPLDEKFGGKYRNPAQELANKLIKDGKETEPQDAIDAYFLMEKCYTQLEKKPSDTVTDDGKGGTATPLADRKTGTTEDVLADMKKNKSWLE